MEFYEEFPEIYTFSTDIKIVAKERPRFAGIARSGINGFKSVVYTPKKTKDFEQEFGLKFKAWLRHVGLDFKCESPMAMHIEFKFASKSNKNKDSSFHSKKPDWDNLGKIVCDSLNKILYEDDCQLWDVRVVKKFNDENKDQIVISFKYSQPEDALKVPRLSYLK